jgi:competence protein ComEC
MLWFHLFTEIKQQRNNLFLWSPMAFAFGIAVTFAHGHWIGPALFIFLLICVLGYLGYYGVKDSAILPLLMLLFVTTLGAEAASLRSYAIWAPALSYPYYGEVQGVIRTIDRSASGSLRVTLRVSEMDPISKRHRPQYVRISFPKYAGDIPEMGQSIKTTAYVTPPQGPVEPDGFDFRRHAYFQSLGGVGYARKGFEYLDAPREQRFWKDRQRRLSIFIAEHMPERSLGFAQAIISGDRLNLSLQVIEDLRRTNLAHLLAISGLHMWLLTTVVFALLRMTCIIIPIGQIRWRARSIAAFGAILVGVAYLGLSGNSIATQRAFVMIACFFGGVILSRRALTLRSLALAALIILALRPEALYSPGFQMSFAATIALVSVFDFITRRGWGPSGLVLNYITGAVVSSVVAGLATAPIATIHFNQISQIGYIANLLAVPVMALVVAPAAVLALALSPLHLAPVGSWFVDLGLTWIQFVVVYLAEFDLAVRMIKTPLEGVCPCFHLAFCGVFCGAVNTGNQLA